MHWLLLRGLAREVRHWEEFPARLGEALPDARIDCLDLPGVGTERARPSPRTVAGIVDDVRARWEPLTREHPGPRAVLGVSLGGMVTMEWCARHPGDFGRAVVINSSAICRTALEPRLRPRALALLGLAGLLTPRATAAPFERVVLRLVSNLRRGDRALIERYAAIRRDAPISHGAFAAQLAAAMRFRCPGPLGIPTLLLSSANDRMVPPACSRRLERELDARIELHPSAGHDLPLDDAAWVAEQVRDWTASASVA